jgi:hypothetical protein
MTSFRLPSIPFVLMAAIAVFCGTSCLNDDNLIGPNCFDGILNNGEELVDCGGPICTPCDPCENGVWDQVLGEQWVDCGGACAPCEVGFNGQLDPGETGIDCGGDTGIDCGELCGDGLLNGNEIDVDCGGPDCEACPSCEDELLNGEELGIDCGGPDCPPCPTDGDCTNGLLDGDELYIDCGGTICPPCDGNMTWKANGTDLVADFETTCSMNGSNTLTVGGVSVTTDGIGMTLPEPSVGWLDGAQITLNESSAPAGACTYNSPSGQTYTSALAGANFTVEILYILPESGGIVVGTFGGSLIGSDGTGGISITQGTFLLPID